ncbi:MAG TPA: hypothetical protein VG488_03715 [Candidatus Angelobacter sp.]|nr:hypothetical protein [Candidatus Angelobacter sp.]
MMETAIRDRFLIALAKFFGESPLRDKPLASVQLCPTELMEEILTSILVNGKVELTLEKINRLMISCRHRLATNHFFQYFFDNVKTIDEFEKAVDRYRIKAMWLFGNFRFAYRSLATCDREEFQQIIRETEPVDEDRFAKREPFSEIQAIAVESLHLLGYIAKGELDDLEMTYKFLQQLLNAGIGRSKVLQGMGPNRLERSLGVLRNHGLEPSVSDFADLPVEELKSLVSKVASVLDPLRRSREEAVKVGLNNTDRYLTLPFLDVYVATSMREKKDFVAQHEFIKQVFSDPQVEPLRLRYFDPMLSYVENRITKGVIEMLMLRRASVTIYLAGSSDTLGKDSELAATLAQGKAVIVYVPHGEQNDKRAQIFREDHPLGLQIAVNTGVAHGIIVVRSPEQCATMVRKVMLRERTFNIEHEKGVFLLREKETNSVLRVVTDDPLLTHAFWAYFNQ